MTDKESRKFIRFSHGPWAMGTGTPTGTHQNFKIVGTVTQKI